jgi:hypothetical protein
MQLTLKDLLGLDILFFLFDDLRLRCRYKRTQCCIFLDSFVTYAHFPSPLMTSLIYYVTFFSYPGKYYSKSAVILFLMMYAAVTKTAFSSFSLVKFFDFDKFSMLNLVYHHLSNPHSWFDYEFLFAKIDQYDSYFSSIS